MFMFGRKPPLHKARQALNELYSAVNRLRGYTGGRKQRPRHPVSPLVSLYWRLDSLSLTLQRLEAEAAQGNSVSDGRKELMDRFNALLSEARRLNTELWHRGVSLRHRRPPLQSLEKPLTKLARAIQNFREHETPFQRLLKELMRRANVTFYRPGSLTDVDAWYIARLASGKRTNPSREVVTKLAIALMSRAVSRDDVNQLLKTLGYPPLAEG